jgi:hypothetical protein
MSGYLPEDHDCRTEKAVSTIEVQYVNRLIAYLDLLGLDGVGRYDSTHGGGRVEGTALDKCPWKCFSEHLKGWAGGGPTFDEDEGREESRLSGLVARDHPEQALPPF